MLKRTAATALILTLLHTSAAAADCASQYLRAAREVGHGEGRHLIFHAYDAKLLAPHGTFAMNKPFALTLTYRMQFSGKAIAREAAAQMRRMNVAGENDINRWQQLMQTIFPDVTPGMAITGLRLKSGATVFCTTDGEIGRMTDPAFADAFFSIWLGAGAENQDLRHQLTGTP